MKPGGPADGAILYTRPGCAPCFVLRRSAARASRRHGIRLRVVDVGTNPDFEARFGREIPVLVLPGGRTLRGRVEPAELESAFREARDAIAGRRIGVVPWLRRALAAVRRGRRTEGGA